MAAMPQSGHISKVDMTNVDHDCLIRDNFMTLNAEK